MEKEFKKLKAELTRSNIVIEWTEYKAPAGLNYSPEIIQQKEIELNAICKVLAVGEDVKLIKVGRYALMGGAGRLIRLDGNVYGIVKEHMIDMHFATPPVIGEDDGDSQGSIMTDLTQKQLDRFGDKHAYKA
jgi:hypothetical protein